MVAYGSLYNSLPKSIFDAHRYLLGEEVSNEIYNNQYLMENSIILFRIVI
jgi:hypothetical protein